MGELFWFLAEAFNGQQVEEGRSALSGKVGERVFGPNVDLHDDPYHDLLRNRPFDGEGLPTRRVALVEGGVVKGFVYDRKTAAKVGVEPTGHGLPVPNIVGAIPSSLVMAGGSTSVDDMVKGTKKGILVTRLWYIRLVDPKKLIVTGMTRDGTFLVENGKITQGVKNLRFNESLIHMLSNVEAISPQERIYGFAVPGLLVKDFAFTSATLF
jgi:predicted Zn-dependent protease